MKRLLIIGLLLFAIVVGSLFFFGGDITDSDRPGEDEPKAFLHVELINNSEVVDGPVIEYADLTSEQQAFFEQAMSDDSYGTPMFDDVDHTVWYDNSAVQYQNRTYRVTVSET